MIQEFNFKVVDKVFIIAELSANHNGSLRVAIETIRAAKRAGADAVKLQTYTAETLTLDSDRDDFIPYGMVKNIFLYTKRHILHGNGM